MKKIFLLVSLVLFMMTNVLSQETTTTTEITTTSTTTIENTTTTTIPQIQERVELDYGIGAKDETILQDHLKINTLLDNITMILADKVSLERVTLSEICYGESKLLTDQVSFVNMTPNSTVCYLRVFRKEYGSWSANLMTKAYKGNSEITVLTSHIKGNNTIEGIEMNVTPSEINITCHIVNGKTVCDFPSIITYIPIEMGVSDGNLVYGINFTTTDIRRMFDSYNTTSDRLDLLYADVHAQEGYLFDSNKNFRDSLDYFNQTVISINQTVNFMISQANETIYRNNKIVDDTLKKSQSSESSGFWKGFATIGVLIVITFGCYWVYYNYYSRRNF